MRCSCPSGMRYHAMNCPTSPGATLNWDVDRKARETVVWGDNVGVTWDNAPDDIKEAFALTRLFWFCRMIVNGGPDDSALDREVYDQGVEATEWLGPILKARAKAAGG